MSSEADTGGAGAYASVFSVSDRVVWLGSLGTRLGTVRWLGELPQLRSGTTVGIELDYELPRGGTDGWHEGRFLFRARAKHGQLVSPQELVLEHRYFGKPDPACSEQQPPLPVPGPNLTARDLIEDAMARVAAEQRVLRDRGRRPEEAGEVLVGEGAGPAAYGAPLTMLEPPWRVAAAQAAARGHKRAECCR
ncbi:uncharacterized protein LOC122367610 [Amphibalanus amphitrite]|uniref:uncharacterized protein LOC122367610 n=1 Tax=Amphibalanus amphitrite TaxID=1232801 RepID=UPI001C90A899|nr:uncharacterized protein LOC122367610 [Amphibalanus amphitrite]